jgi:hypothetical protein
MIPAHKHKERKSSVMPSGIATWQIRKENEIGEDMHMDLPS